VKGDFDYILTRTDFQDYRDYATKTMAELRLERLDVPPGFEWDAFTTTLEQVIGPGGVAAAVTSLQTGIVYLGEVYFATDNWSLQGSIIVHETLHVAFGNHVEVANTLGIRNSEGGTFQPGEERGAADAIITWMTNGCHQ
jgi:hypothetical protein